MAMRELNLLRACLEEEEDGVSTNAYPQGIIRMKIEEKRRYEDDIYVMVIADGSQDQDGRY
jgi:hypothetical protein